MGIPSESLEVHEVERVLKVLHEAPDFSWFMCGCPQTTQCFFICCLLFRSTFRDIADIEDTPREEILTHLLPEYRVMIWCSGRCRQHSPCTGRVWVVAMPADDLFGIRPNQSLPALSYSRFKIVGIFSQPVRHVFGKEKLLWVDVSLLDVIPVKMHDTAAVNLQSDQLAAMALECHVVKLFFFNIVGAFNLYDIPRLT